MEEKAGDAGLDHVQHHNCLRRGPEVLAVQASCSLGPKEPASKLATTGRQGSMCRHCWLYILFYFSSHGSAISYKRNLLGKEPDATFGPWRRSDGLQLGLMSWEKLIPSKSGNQLTSGCLVRWTVHRLQAGISLNLEITTNGIKQNLHCNPGDDSCLLACPKYPHIQTVGTRAGGLQGSPRLL